MVMRACVVIAVAASSSVAGWTWTTLEYPGPLYTTTSAYGVDGDNIVGKYNNSDGYLHGFLYSISTWTSLDYPAAVYRTDANDISGNNIVGRYYIKPEDHRAGLAHGFRYDGTTWTTLDYPGAYSTTAWGISGNRIVGECTFSGSGISGFLYDGATWTTLNYPGAGSTTAHSVDGNSIVGVCWIGNRSHGFLYKDSTWTTIDYPGAKGTSVYGVSGNNIVGFYQDTFNTYHGFLYNGTTWTTLDHPDSGGPTWAFGIDGNSIVGQYTVNYPHSATRGFLLTIPEPATISLLALGGLTILRKQR